MAMQYGLYGRATWSIWWYNMVQTGVKYGLLLHRTNKYIHTPVSRVIPPCSLVGMYHRNTGLHLQARRDPENAGTTHNPKHWYQPKQCLGVYIYLTTPSVATQCRAARWTVKKEMVKTWKAAVQADSVNVTKAYGEVQVHVQAFLTSAQDGGE
jgi:hypothetical protein